MRIVKVYNNNVALVEDSHGREYVVQGRGVAFGRRAGDVLERSAVERCYAPVSPATPESFAALVADIPADYIAVAEEIVALGGRVLGIEKDGHTAIALADHICGAVRRCRAGTALTYPLEWEVRLLYPREIEVGTLALALAAERLSVRLPAVEAVPLALHFVNAQAGAGLMTDAMRSVGQVRGILALVETEYGIDIAEESLDTARFAAHLRHLFLACLRGRAAAPSFPARLDALIQSFRRQDERAYDCARRIAALLTERLGWRIDGEETLYIALHVQRMTRRAADPPRAVPGKGDLSV